MRRQRQHKRYEKNLSIKFLAAGRSYDGITNDFSQEGCFIKTAGTFAPNTVVHMEVKLPDNQASRLTGIIRRVVGQEGAAASRGIGIEIIQDDTSYTSFFKSIHHNGSKTSVNPETEEQPEYRIISCTGCRVKNKIPASRLSDNPKCGKCGAPLDNKEHSGSGAIYGGSSGYSKEGSLSGAGAPARPVPKALKVGDTIGGRYQIQEIFGGEGKSSMGVVYMCYDREHHKILALKTLQHKYLDSAKLIDTFKKEALAWIHLGKHPNIVRANWVRELDGHIFIGCEYQPPDGEGRNSLTPFLATPFSMKRALKWAIQFCFGMEYACSKGVTPHRDVKPDNIMITLQGDVMITDFGLAGLGKKSDRAEEMKSLLDKNRGAVSFLASESQKMVAGSPPWMAPEQFYGVAEVRTDIYSFGIVLYQMVNGGNLPFQPKKGESWRTAHKEYPVPSVPRRGAPLEKVIMKCLEKRRDHRYNDFRELRMDLEEIFRREITKKTGELPPSAPLAEELGEAELINKGMSMANLGLLDEGIRNYRESIKQNPGNVEAHYNLGNAFAKKGQFSEAAAAYREALRLEPDMTAAHFNLGIALFAAGQIDLAIKAYKDAIRTDLTFGAAYVNLGIAYHKKGLVDQAIKAYQDAVTITPNYADAYYKLGITYASGNMLDEAIKAFRETVRINASCAEAHYNLGVAFGRKGMTDEAIDAYEHAVGAKDPYPDAQYNLGMTLINRKRYGDALFMLEKFFASASDKDTRRAKVSELLPKLKTHAARNG